MKWSQVSPSYWRMGWDGTDDPGPTFSCRPHTSDINLPYLYGCRLLEDFLSCQTTIHDSQTRWQLSP